jgi:hypothetical protein
MVWRDWLTAGVLAVVFSAGGYVAVLTYAVRHLNGLGRKSNRMVALLTLWADTDEKRRQVAEFIAGK